MFGSILRLINYGSFHVGFRVWKLGCKVYYLGFGFMCKVNRFEFRLFGFWFRVLGFGYLGVRLRVWGWEFYVVHRLGHRV